MARADVAKGDQIASLEHGRRMERFGRRLLADCSGACAGQGCDPDGECVFDRLEFHLSLAHGLRRGRRRARKDAHPERGMAVSIPLGEPNSDRSSFGMKSKVARSIS